MFYQPSAYGLHKHFVYRRTINEINNLGSPTMKNTHAYNLIKAIIVLVCFCCITIPTNAEGVLFRFVDKEIKGDKQN